MENVRTGACGPVQKDCDYKGGNDPDSGVWEFFRHGGKDRG
ncbi:hypothetical protein K040078D81_10950 [Blautia hominis]|uniref:Uncharacterized protein n=1 Tax=Blautia hominis TaxID=2025493 RepID=A0ABQ0B6C4_9FIRM